MKRCAVLALGLLLMSLATGCCCGGRPFGNGFGAYGPATYDPGPGAYAPAYTGTAYNFAPYSASSCGCGY